MEVLRLFSAIEGAIHVPIRDESLRIGTIPLSKNLTKAGPLRVPRDKNVAQNLPPCTSAKFDFEIRTPAAPS